jgi:hypothetical protein
MVFFFALAAKEVFEATLPGGPLASPGRAVSPLAAAIGGMVAPAVIYVGLASILEPADLIRGWGYSLRNGHRILRDDRPSHPPGWPSSDPVSVAAGDRRRCGWADHFGDLLPIGNVVPSIAHYVHGSGHRARAMVPAPRNA